MISTSLRSLRVTHAERFALRFRHSLAASSPIISTSSSSTHPSSNILVTSYSVRRFTQTAKLLDAEKIDGKSIAQYVVVDFENLLTL